MPSELTRALLYVGRPILPGELGPAFFVADSGDVQLRAFSRAAARPSAVLVDGSEARPSTPLVAPGAPRHAEPTAYAERVRGKPVSGWREVLEGTARWSVGQGDALAALAEMPSGCVDGIVRAFPKPSEKHHITGKPVEVLRALARIAPPDGVVLDPFAGGGSTGCGALLEGRRFIGFELVPEYVEVIRERLVAEAANSTPRATAAGQVPLFRESFSPSAATAQGIEQLARPSSSGERR